MPRRFALAMLAILPLAACAASHGRAQRSPSSEREVIAVVEDLFGAMRTRDRARLERALAPQVMLTVADGARGASAAPVDRAAIVDRFTAGDHTNDERIWSPEVRIDGDIATLWAPYTFRRDGALSHCGYDAFQLMRQDGRWVIVAIAYTRALDGCEAFELASVAARTPE